MLNSDLKTKLFYVSSKGSQCILNEIVFSFLLCQITTVRL